MSDTNNRPPSPNDTVRGDAKAMPNRGTSTGMSDTYGASTGADATNSLGRINGKSDPMMTTMNHKDYK